LKEPPVPETEREHSFVWEGAIRETGEGYAWDFTLSDEAAAQRVLPLDVASGSDYLSAWAESKHPLDRQGMGERSALALRTGAPSYSQEYRCFNRHGEEQWLREEAHLDPLGPGRWKAQGICTDVTGHKRTESALARSESYFRRLFDHSLDAIFVHDAEGRVVDANPRACESLGYTREEILTLRATDYDLEADPERIASLIQHLLAGGEATVQSVHRRKDGRTFPVEVQLGLLEGGDEPRILACVRDVSERWRIETALRESEQTLRSFFDTPRIVTGIAEVHGEDLLIVEGNKASARLFGLQEGSIRNRRASELGTPPEVLRQWIAYCRESAARREPVQFDYERKVAGDVHWFGVSLSPVGNGGSRFAYIIQDVTERKRAEADLRASETLFREAMVHAPIGIALVSLDGYFMNVNPALCEIVGYGEDEFRFLTFQEITHSEDLDADLEHVAKLLDGSERSYRMEKRYVHKRGHFVWILLNVSLARNEEGKPLYFIAQMQDITRQKGNEEELKRLNAELYRTSRRDHLTGLKNRLQLQEDLEVMRDRSRRYGHSYCVAMCDVDHFKAYNDHHGHLAGDQALKRVAETIRAQCRVGDIAYRYGGEEFLIVFPEQTLESAQIAMERIRGAVESMGIPRAGGGGAVTISGGVAVLYPNEEKTLDRLLQEADAALYRSKETGRNRVSRF
jgi:diguanylate cyclase (GGDEF)-like protein/PAS domain S-box-containing protein